MRYAMLATAAAALAAMSGTAQAQEPPRFDGVTVTAALHSGVFEISWATEIPGLLEKYGIELEMVGIPVNELFDKQILELATGSGAYDLIMFNPGWYGDYVEYLEPLTDLMDKWDPAWEDIHEGFRIWENTYEGVPYTLTMDGDVIMAYYRADIFGDPEEQAAFSAAYGYDLAPPQTWDQLLDIAEFFRRDTDGDGEIDFYGYADQPKRGRSFYWWLLRYITYTSPDPQYFDPDTMEPLINSPAAVASLENYQAAIALAPPGVLGWEWDELNAAFMSGNLAMILHWPDEGLMVDRLKGNVPGAELGYAIPPGAIVDGTLYQRTMTFGGWVIGVAKDSDNIEAAYTALYHMLSPEVSTRLTLMPGMDFFRQSHFDDPAVQAVADPAYLQTFSDVIAINFPELRIPGGFEYYDTLDIHVQQALAGEVTAQEALDAAAAEWNDITDRLGRDEQAEKYRAAMGL